MQKVNISAEQGFICTVESILAVYIDLNNIIIDTKEASYCLTHIQQSERQAILDDIFREIKFWRQK